ncbi:MAG: thioredoxin domain-containing protein [Thermoguttaceae bacterium]|nr:thioredoxin domain-containing protein [Thermoguttaceae bacterium]MDW8038656.1 thioredoxin domain-containing protein [Thermoguttaceae bacterium]
MKIKSGLFVFLGGAVSPFLADICMAQQGVRWEPISIQAAQQQAAQTNRLVLVHFWSPNCGPCQKMERWVFSRPDVAATVETYYVPVKINADQFPYTARQFGITALPTDLILSPNGQVIRRFQGAVPAEQYIAQLHRVAEEMQLAGPGRPAGSPAAGTAPLGPNTPGAPPPSSPWGPPMPSAGDSATGTPQLSGPPTGPGWPASWTQPSGPVNVSGIPPSFGSQNSPVMASVADRYAGSGSGGQFSSPPSSATAYGGGIGTSGFPPGPPENRIPPLADRTFSPPPGGQLAAPPLSSPSLPVASGSGSGQEMHAPQGAASPNSPRGSEWPRSENATSVGKVPPESAGSSPEAAGRTPETMGQDGWPPGLPPLGLEGYCPVELVEKRRWVLGTHPWGVIHEGRTYMCAGPEEQKKFLANPDRYAPVLSGNDVVWAVERGQQVPGRREYGIFYRGRVYLFAEPGTLDAFRKNPRRYLEAISAPAPETASRR